jgi:2-dehydropantoate 2-reductase
MKIAVYGFGAVGGLIGARLAAAGFPVSAIARGETLAALHAHGARIQEDGGIASIPLPATREPATLGVQDLVVLAVKTSGLAELAQHIAPLIGPDTVVLCAMNGVPWWFFEGIKGSCVGTRLQSCDPDGMLQQAIPLRHIIGCVVHLSSACPQPGVVQPGFGKRLILGEPSGELSPRLAELAGALHEAGFDVETSADIRSDIWYKLWGNMTLNPISAITGASGDKILDDPLVRGFCLSAMREAAEIGARIGCPIAQSGTDRLEVARRLGSFKTSMLQDAEAGKPLEIDALVTAVHEIGQLTGVPTPNIDALLGLVRLYARTHGLYPA